MPTTSAANCLSVRDVDALVKRREPDLWLASRLMPKLERQTFLVKTALHLELLRIEAITSETLIARIRFQWWRETLQDWLSDTSESKRGQPPHPLIGSFAALSRSSTVLELTNSFLERRGANLEDMSSGPVASYASLFQFLAGSSQTVDPNVHCALARCGNAYGHGVTYRQPAGFLHEKDIDQAYKTMAPLAAMVTLAPLYLRGQTPGPLQKRYRLLRALLGEARYSRRILRPFFV